MSKNSVEEIQSEEDFKSLIKMGVTVIDFFAEWCGPCRLLTPLIQTVAEELSGKVTFAKLDIEKLHVIAKELHVTSVPTLILFKDGEEKNRLVGLRDQQVIKEFALSV